MQYTITQNIIGRITVEYADGSWAEIPVTDEMTAEEIDYLAYAYANVTTEDTLNTNVSAGETRTAVPEPPAPVTEPELLVETLRLPLGAASEAYSQNLVLFVALKQKFEGDDTLWNRLDTLVTDLFHDCDNPTPDGYLDYDHSENDLSAQLLLND